MRTKLVMVAVALCAGVLAGGLAGCSTLGGSALDHATPSAFGPWTEALADVRVEHRQTIEGVGAAQGLVVHNGFIYVFGDAETGVIREYRVAWTGGEPRLAYTGREILCTVDGVDVAPHPTGLTFHPELGCYLGDTVKRVGTIFKIDFDRALAGGTLDGAILNRIDDDAAVNGTRPEFVEHGGEWFIATADYGDIDNQLRLYDPEGLAAASATSEPGVLVQAMPTGAFVQSMRWLPASGYLVLAQNQIAGLLYRLTFVPLAEARERDDARFPVIDIDGPNNELDDELEGWAPLADARGGRDGWFVMVSAMREDNVTFLRMRLPSDLLR